MKLFGNSKKSRHGGSHASSGKRETTSREPARRESAPEPSKSRKPKKKMNILTKILIILLVILLALASAIAVFYFTEVKPPEINPNKNDPSKNTPSHNDDSQDNPKPNPSGPSSTAKPEDPEPQDPVDTDPRYPNKYTFLAVGMDDGNGNTDTIMLATFDAENYTLDIMSIPRDTLTYVNQKSRRINTLYALGGSDGLLDGVADIVGYRPDFYGVINLKAFIRLVDGIGGVDYYVQQDMNYDDPAQNLHIHFTKGMHHFSGQDAMEFCRFRKGYSDQDIGRIHAQQDFLLTAAKQILRNADDVPISTLVDIFMNYVKTDLDAGECTWFAKELLKLDFENINFYTVPGEYNDYVDGINCVTIDVDALLEIVNAHLNPFKEDITVKNLDILTRDKNGRLYFTTDVS